MSWWTLVTDAIALASIVAIAYAALLFGAAAGLADMPAVEPLQFPMENTQ